MNKILLLTILLIGWIIAGSYYYTCVWCNLCSGEQPYTETYTDYNNTNSNIKGLNIVDGSSFNATSNENLIFSRSDASPIVKSSVQRKLNELAQYLTANPNKKVYLTGKYKNGEQTVNGFNNLGLARANSIGKNLINAGVNATQIVEGSKSDNTLHEVNSLVYGAVDFDFAKPAGFVQGNTATANAGNGLVINPTTKINDGNLNINVSNDAIVFDKNGASPKISTQISEKLNEVAAYLKKNRDRILQITGLYASNERNSTQQPNLGLARAEAVKFELTKKGASADQINTTFAIEKLPMKKGFVEYSFKTKQEVAQYEQEVLDKVQSNLERIGSMNVYFKTGSDDIELSDELSDFIGNVKYYLSRKQTQKVRLIGHTDNVGNEQSNTALGLDRAKTIKGFFIRDGVKANQITTTSEGPRKPIAPNTTDDGRAKNRRVEISIK